MVSLRSVLCAVALACGASAAGQEGPALPPEELNEDRVLQTSGADDAIKRLEDGSVSGEIVVRGSRERRSSWRVADTPHALIYSNGREENLVRLARNIERLHLLLRALFAGENSSQVEMPRMKIILLGSDRLVQKRSRQPGEINFGPFSRPFGPDRSLVYGLEGPVLVVSRRNIRLNVDWGNEDWLETADSEGQFDQLLDDDDDLFHSDPKPFGFAGGGSQGSGKKPPPVMRSWATRVYSAYAQHYFLTNHPAAYPRWYLDGVGAFFGTISIRKDGAIEFGRTPREFARVLSNYPRFDASKILSGEYLPALEGTAWIRDHAWLLTHYFFLADVTAERREQFVEYMNKVENGVSHAEAARVFGEISLLNSEIEAYGRGPTYFRWEPVALEQASEHHVVRLSKSEAEILAAEMELDLSLTSHGFYGDQVKGRQLAELLADLAPLSSTADGGIAIAKAQCALSKFEECALSAEKVLAMYPNDARVLAWKGVALLGQAQSTAPEERGPLLQRARRAIVLANRTDPENLRALRSYFDSFVELGEAAPEIALLGMLKIVERLPAAAEPRLALATEMERQGRIAEARSLVRPLTSNSYNAQIQQRAMRLLGNAKSAM